MTTLEHLWKRGKEFLGVDTPIMCGAMTWISESQLVSTVSNLGAFGCLAAGNAPADLLAQDIDETFKKTDKPFAVNLITIAPNFREHLPIVVDKQVPFVIFAGGIPKGSDIKFAKKAGAKVMAFASTESIAHRLVDNGVDGLMLEGSEAGGHIGHVSLAILLQQVLFQVDSVPIFVAGGIGSGRLIPHLLLMGAAGVQLGTRFVLTDECKAHSKFKESFIRARARDAVATPQVGSELQVVAVRSLRNKGMDDFANLQMELIRLRRRGEITQHEAQEEVERYWMGSLQRAVQDGDISHGSMMAGQSVGLSDCVKPMKDLIKELIDDAETELERIGNRLSV